MNLLLTLLLGIVLVTVANALLVRMARVAPPLAAALVALATLLLYLPLAFVFWPGGDVATIHLTAFLLTCLMCGLFWQARAQGDTATARGYLGPRVIIGFFMTLVVVDSVFVLVAERGLPVSVGSALLPEPRNGNAVRFAFPGVVADNYQKKEALYNEFLAQHRRQEARGWQIQKGWLDGKPRAEQSAVFQLKATTREGLPVSGAAARGTFAWAGNSELDTLFTMEEVSPGLYQAELSLPTAGRWQLLMSLHRDDEQHEIRATTTVAPTES